MADTRARSAKRTTTPRATAAGRSAEETSEPRGQHVCPVAFCPIGMALTAANRASPEVLEHLTVAARELLLAVRAVVDARAGDFDDRERPSGLERIEIA
ncbi:MAG TPA: hypothetical protein VF984_11960 [Actinomycetota bacterium]